MHDDCDGWTLSAGRARSIRQSASIAAPRLTRRESKRVRCSADERVYDNYSDMAGAYRRTLCIHHHIMLTLDLRHYGQREMIEFAVPTIDHECVRITKSHVLHELHTCAMGQLAMLRDVSGAGRAPARIGQSKILTLTHL